MRLLLIEDDQDLCKALCISFRSQGYETDTCHNGEDGFVLALQPFYDVIILDRMLPQMDGLTLLSRLRKKNCKTPVIMLTALGQIGDRVDGLEAGADDYLTKPFDTRELLARIKALLRRPSLCENTEILKFADLSLDNREHLLCKGDKEMKLSPKETLLMECFFQNSEKLIRREFLLGKVWGMHDIVEEANLDTYVCFLRRRIKNLGSQVRIETVRGSGYKLSQSSAT